jgi:nitroreductase / dihydropteridine reductase
MASDIIEKLSWRYATKKFDPTRELSEAKLNTLKESFNLTASSYGLQPIKMVVVKDGAMKEKLVSATFNQTKVAEASHLLVLCSETQISPNYIKDHFSRVQQTRNTEREILEPFENALLDTFAKMDRDAIIQWMDNQVFLAMGNLLTVCALEQIDACPIEGFRPEAYEELLQLKSYGLRPVLLLAVGYRAVDDMFSGMEKVRRGVEEVFLELPAR